MEKILAIFTLREKEDMGKFMVYGEYAVTEFTGMNSVVYKYPEFIYVNAKQNKDGKITDYKPTGSTWHGVKYQCDDMIVGLICDVIRGANSYIVEYLDIGLKEIIDTYTADSLELEQRKLPKKILHGSEMNLYELYLVTDNFAYYSYYDSLLMLRTDSKEIVSDNYFAEVGFWDSIENIKNGKEIHLWGELPES